MTFKDYDDQDQLKTVQRVSTKILAELDRVCRKLEIPYVIYAGTAIGAVRHGGFIPWDDDVDIAMPRHAYERFLAEAPGVMSDHYLINNTYTAPGFPSTCSHFGLKGTLFIPEFYRNATYRTPMSIDVFPFDNVSDDEKKFAAQIRRTWIWGRLKFIRATPTPYLSFGGPKALLVHSACFAAHWGMRLLRMSPEFIQRKWEGAARAYEHETTERMTDFTDRFPRSWAVTHDDLFPAIDVPFEDIVVKLPRNYDSILTSGYGDYMQLPPVHERKNHRPCLVDTGEH
ncbi:MAG: LicD family protein [Ruaniaceae bacterium]|nr:LicD family protein [Ruaniaceae bacterium]